MSIKVLTERQIVGEFVAALEADPAGQLLAQIAWMNMDSDQESETYRWLGQSPAMREWLGERQAKGFNDFEYTIKNRQYEASVEIKKRWLNLDKTGQAMMRIREMAARANVHMWGLVADLLRDGGSTVAYDGQFFFDTDHSEGESGTQDNDITVDISALAAQVHGSVTSPSAEEMALTILKAIEQILGFKDDQGEPMNEFAREFLVMAPPSLASPVLQSINNQFLANGVSNPIIGSGYTVRPYITPRLALGTAWTDEIAVLRTDAPMKPFIIQVEQDLETMFLGPESEHAKKTGNCLFGVDAIHGAGYGLWQYACLATMT